MVMKTGKWICYPGDYEIFLSEKVHTRRYQRDFPVAPFWKVDSPWHNVRFHKKFHLDAPTRLHFYAEGRMSVFFLRPVKDKFDVYSYDFKGYMDVPAGDHDMEIWVYNPSGLPCLKIDSDSLITDETFEVGFDQMIEENASVCDCGTLTPNTYALPTRVIAVERQYLFGDDVIYDFGKIVSAFASLTGKGEYRLYFGETLSEALNRPQEPLEAEETYFGVSGDEYEDTFCEQVEFFSLAEEGTHRSEISKAFRYLRVVGGKHLLTVEEEYDDKPLLTVYENKNERLKRIFDVSTYTFSVCAREFYLDGAKRDRWLWGGDAYEAIKAEYFYQRDLGRIRRSLIALLGKSPVVRYVNQIIDYTFYTILGVWEYYENTGDKDFLKQVQPILTEHLKYCTDRLSEKGFIVNEVKNGKINGWGVFVDWGELPRKDGEVSFVQILFWAALQATAKIYGVLGLEYERILNFAETLRKRVDETFWDEEKGVYFFARNDGVPDQTVTSHANAFALLYGFADEKKSKRIAENFVKGNVSLSITPFMLEFTLAALFEVGEKKKALDMLQDYWGGMIDIGATTFWETYQKGEREEVSTAMYGRPFGRSHCHIWGAGPLYLIPRYCFGIEPSLEFGEKYRVTPDVNLIEGSSIEIPLKRGTLKVGCENGYLSVFSDEIDGEVVINGKSFPICKGEKFYEKV